MRRGLSIRMLAGLVAGAALGILAHLALGDAPALAALIDNVTEPIGQIFLRLLFMLVIPLIVSALALAVAGLGEMRQLGRIGLKTLAYTVAVSSIAVVLGVGLVNLVRPGAAISPELRERLAKRAVLTEPSSAPAGVTGVDFLVALVPRNVVDAMAKGDMLAVMFFSLFLGVGLAITQTDGARRLEETLQGVYDVVMRLLEVVIGIAPIAVACLMFILTARL